MKIGTVNDSSNSGYVQANGIRFHYREWGHPGLPDLLLAHGWSTAIVVWTDVAELLQDSYHVIAPDNRGAGESDRPDSGYSINNYAEDYHHIIGALGLHKPYFVGHSWGGSIGTYLAAVYRNELSGVVLEDPLYWKILDGFTTLIPGFIRSSQRSESEVLEEARNKGLSDSHVEQALYLHRRFPTNALNRVATQNRSWALDCEAFISKIGVPTLVIVADIESGGYMSGEEMEHHRRIATPQVEFRLWKGVGHAMHGTDPDRFVREVRAFLSSC